MEVKKGKNIPSLFLWRIFKYKPFRKKKPKKTLIWLLNPVLTQNVNGCIENARAKEVVGSPLHITERFLFF